MVVHSTPSQPGMLPSNGNVLVVPAKTSVSPNAVAQFDRIMFAYRKRSGSSETRTCLLCRGILHSVQGGCAANPEVAVQRDPEPSPGKVTAQVAFEGSDWLLGL